MPHGVVLQGGTLVDGSGAPPLRADVALEGARIAAVGSSLAGDAVDCAGMVVAPGFIDTHSHSDLKVLADPALPMKVRQGITLEVLGQDGLSVAPVREGERAAWRQKLAGLLGDFGVQWDWSSVADYLERLRAARPVPDLAYLLPHGAMRQYVVGDGDRRATATELETMRVLLRTALAQGARGLSTGLIYPPCCYADIDELISLGKVLAEAERPLVVHMRSESDRIQEAVREMVRVAGESGCTVHISHLKVAGKDNWEKAPAVLALIAQAHGRGLRFTADLYPYAAGSTLLGAILPPAAHAGGAEATLGRLRDPDQRMLLRRQLSDPSPADWDNFWKWSGPEGIVIADIPSGRHPEWVGQNLAEIARLAGKDPFETVFDLLEEERLGVAMVSFSQDEGVMERFLAQPFVNVCTDGLLGGRPHPRAYGSYPRILGRYVREKKLLTLEEAVRKMTSQAAAAFGLGGVGLVQEGFRANLVVFDPEKVADRATFENPAQFPVGIRDVLVGGEFVVRAGRSTGRRPGRVVE
ncbi:MAG TPA: D-aminoacylase [Vicinamibacteria bacterium]|nr:D-aminoacylase [Vicinamibacteria bacterium]